MIAMAGILHLVFASHVLGGEGGIIGSLVEPGLWTAGFSIAKLVSLIFTPAIDLGSGEYTLMLGAQNDAITVMKAVKVDILINNMFYGDTRSKLKVLN
jgi:hypothetical protein